MFILDVFAQRLERGCQTLDYPEGTVPTLPDRHGGALRLDPTRCPAECQACLAVCPTEALTRPKAGPVRLDLGQCLFCSGCVAACPAKSIVQTGDHRMAVTRREDLVLGGGGPPEIRLAHALSTTMRRLFGRSLRLRQVSAGGCNACEADTNVLGTIGWDLGRFGIQFVASPRHADGLLITGPVSRNMEVALRKTYEAVPDPKLVIAVGSCAIAGGPFRQHPEVLDGASSVVPVDLFIPGCPPHPLTILDGLLRWLDRLGPEKSAAIGHSPATLPTRGGT